MPQPLWAQSAVMEKGKDPAASFTTNQPKPAGGEWRRSNNEPQRLYCGSKVRGLVETFWPQHCSQGDGRAWRRTVNGEPTCTRFETSRERS